MMLLFLIAELIALYLFSHLVTKMLFQLFFLVFRSRSVALTILLVLTFPGTVIHELSHLFAAGILGVPAGKLTLEPEFVQTKKNKAGLPAEVLTKAGSVAIAETDPFRRYAIGLAPLVGGIIILTAIAYFLPERSVNWTTWVLGYLLFSVSNGMFSSSADLKGFLPFAIALLMFVGAFYYLGLRIALTGTALTLTDRITTTLVRSLAIVIAVNALLAFFAWVVTFLLTRLFRVRIVPRGSRR